MMRRQTALTAAILVCALPCLVLLAVAWGETGNYAPSEALRLLFSGEASNERQIVLLRLARALCAAGVGGSLALGGAMAQGLFRNPLAEPSLLGVSGGAALGAMLGIALLGGYGKELFKWLNSSGLDGETLLNSTLGFLAVPLCAMLGAFAAVVFVYRWSTRYGVVSVATILLTGLALNSLVGAAMTALQSLLLDDFNVTRAIVSWGFGTLNDRSFSHVLIVFSGAAIALAAIPFLGLELDLMAGGEEDAAALGADVRAVKSLGLFCIAVSTASAVSVCGQIAFVGLLVPHLVRRFSGPKHRPLLALSFLCGSALLLSVLIFQCGLCATLERQCLASGAERWALLFQRIKILPPGIMTALAGSPFFLLVLLKQNSRNVMP